jgi:hypothetical protein
MKHLNRIFFLLLVGTLLQLSCSKENSFTEYGKDELVNLQNFKPNSQSTSQTPNSCYNTYITDTYKSLKLAGTIPFANLVGNALANAIQQDYNNYVNCLMTSGPGSSNGGGDEEVPIDNGVDVEVNQEVNPAEILRSLNNITRNFSTGQKTFLSVLKQAHNYALSQNLQLYTPEEKMLAISKSIYALGFDNVFANIGEHGVIDGDIYHLTLGIAMFAGKIKMTTDLYNYYIADNATEHVNFAASRSIGWIIFSAPSNLTLQPAEYTISITSNYPSVEYYNNASDVFDFVSDLLFSTPVYYNQSNNKLYSNANNTTYVPNGFYRLPNSFSLYEQRNFLIYIQNGEVVGPYGL